MDDSSHARARAVFFEALDLPVDERQAHVEKACGSDLALRAEVETLLRALEEGEGFGSAGPGRDLRAAAEEAFRARDDGAGPGLPRRIGKHDVIGCLGEGGMGVVYEAEQRNPRRRVAIKVLRPTLVTPELIESFRREAELLGRLHHPGIASVHEAGQARPWGLDGPELPYLVMELVHGQPITAYAAKARLSLEQKLELLARTCDAVQHAHDRGVVHRDLKPGNVLVDETGQPRVLDFGVARALDAEPGSRSALGEEAHVVGTLSYMSPEQLADVGARSGTSSDVYALGVLLHELLVSRLPLQLVGLPVMEAVRRIRDVDPPRLGAIDGRLAGDVESIVAKALEKDPARRYASPAHLAADLRRHLANEPILARPPKAIYRARKFARRHRGLVAAWLGIVLVLAAGGVTSGVLALRATRARRQAEAASAEAERANYRAQLGAAVGSLREGDALTARAHLEAAPADLREWTWRHVRASLDDSLGAVHAEVGAHPLLARAPGGWLVVGEGGVSLVAQDGSALRLAAHRKGRFLAASRDGTRAIELRDGRYLVHDSADLSRQPLDLGGPGGELAVGLPDGSWVVDAGGQLVLASKDGASRLPLGREALGPMLVSPDGATLVAATRSSVEAWRTERMDLPPRRLRAGVATSLAFAPDSSLVLVGDDSGEVQCAPLDARARCEWKSVAAGRQRIVALRVDPQGRHLLAVDRSGRATTWSLGSGAPLGLATTVGHGSARAFYSSDGETVVLPRANGSIVAMTLDGRWTSVPLVGAEAVVEDVTWSDGLMVTADHAGVVRTFAAPTASDRRRLTGHRAYVYSARFTRDGGTIVSVAWDGTLRTWDPVSGTLLRTFPMAGSVARSVRVVRPDRAVVLVEGTVRLVDIGTGAELARVDGHAIDVDAADDRVAIVDGDGGVEIWQWLLKRRVRMLRAIGAAPADARRVAFSGNGRRIAISVGSVVKGHDVDTGEDLWSAASMAGDVLDVAWQPGGDLVAGACRDGAVTIWDGRTGATLREVAVAGGATLALAFHPTEPLLATGSHDGSVQTWDVARGELIARLPAHEDYVKSLAFSPDGTMLVTASGDTTLQVLDAVPLSERMRARR